VLVLILILILLLGGIGYRAWMVRTIQPPAVRLPRIAAHYPDRRGALAFTRRRSRSGLLSVREMTTPVAPNEAASQ
jgi:hypothetical protein